MKKQNLFRVLAASMVCAFAFTLASCDKKGGDEDDDTPKDINTGVLSSTTDAEIIIQDRNVGATEVNGTGTYMTWDEAMEACPEGYALLDMDDWIDLTDSDKYNTSEKIRTGLKMPFVGYYVDNDTELTDPADAFYWTNYGDADYGMYAAFNAGPDETDPGMLSPYAYNDGTERGQVRCQKVPDAE
jgi:hypothetical protein